MQKILSARSARNLVRNGDLPEYFTKSDECFTRIQFTATPAQVLNGEYKYRVLQ